MHDRGIMAAIEAVAAGYSPRGQDTIRFDNRGKHVVELRLMLGALGDAPGRVLDVGGGLGLNLVALRRLLPASEPCLVDRFDEYTPDNKMGAAARSWARSPRRASTFGARTSGRGRSCRLRTRPSAWPPSSTWSSTCRAIPCACSQRSGGCSARGGMLLLSGPTSHSAMSFAKMALGRHPHIDFESWTSDAYFSHYWEYRPRGYRALLERSGFRVARVFLTAEPWRTRARAGYHKGFLSGPCPASTACTPCTSSSSWLRGCARASTAWRGARSEPAILRNTEDREWELCALTAASARALRTEPAPTRR